MIHIKFLPQKTTMNAELYLKIFRRLCERIRCVRLQLWANNSWLFHLDNAAVHSSFKIHDYFAKNQGMCWTPHQIYLISLRAIVFYSVKLKIPSKVIVFSSSDLASCDFFLFYKIKNTLKGHRFQRVEDIQKNLIVELKGNKEEEFSVCFG